MNLVLVFVFPPIFSQSCVLIFLLYLLLLLLSIQWHVGTNHQFTLELTTSAKTDKYRTVTHFLLPGGVVTLTGSNKYHES